MGLAAGALTGAGMKAVGAIGQPRDVPSSHEKVLEKKLRDLRSAARDNPSVGAQQKVEDLRHDLEQARIERQSPARAILSGARKGSGYGALGAMGTFLPLVVAVDLLNRRKIKIGSAASELEMRVLDNSLGAARRMLPWGKFLGHSALVGSGAGALVGGGVGAATADPGDRLRRGLVGAAGGVVAGGGAGAAAKALDWNRYRKALPKLEKLLIEKGTFDPATFKINGMLDPESLALAKALNTDITPVADLLHVVAPIGSGAGVAAGLTASRNHKEKK